eukprot:EG_transcript_27982
MSATLTAALLLAVLVAQEAAYLGLTTLLRRWDKPLEGKGPLLAYQFVSTSLCLYFAGCGSLLWFSEEIDLVLRDHIDGYWEPVQTLATIHTAYQLWDLAAALRFPSMRKAENVVHHSLAAVAAGLSLTPYAHYYAPFFVGVSEISAVALCPVDLFKLFPQLKDDYPIANLASRALFALAHFVVRLWMWPVAAYGLVAESLRGLKSGEVRHPVLAMFCIVGAVPMTG